MNECLKKTNREIARRRMKGSVENVKAIPTSINNILEHLPVNGLSSSSSLFILYLEFDKMNKKKE